jgi:hypothetical protein
MGVFLLVGSAGKESIALDFEHPAAEPVVMALGDRAG